MVAAMWVDAQEEKLVPNPSYTKLVVPHNSVLAIEPYNSTHVAIAPANPFTQEDHWPLRWYFRIGRPGPLGYPGHVGYPGHFGYPGHSSYPGHIGYPGHTGYPGHFGYPGHIGHPWAPYVDTKPNEIVAPLPLDQPVSIVSP